MNDFANVTADQVREALIGRADQQTKWTDYQNARKAGKAPAAPAVDADHLGQVYNELGQPDSAAVAETIKSRPDLFPAANSTAEAERNLRTATELAAAERAVAIREYQAGEQALERFRDEMAYAADESDVHRSLNNLASQVGIGSHAMKVALSELADDEFDREAATQWMEVVERNVANAEQEAEAAEAQRQHEEALRQYAADQGARTEAVLGALTRSGVDLEDETTVGAVMDVAGMMNVIDGEKTPDELAAGMEDAVRATKDLDRGSRQAEWKSEFLRTALARDRRFEDEMGYIRPPEIDLEDALETMEPTERPVTADEFRGALREHDAVSREIRAEIDRAAMASEQAAAEQQDNQ